VRSQESPTLITEPPTTPLKEREKMAEILFEKFEIPAMYVGIQGVLSLYTAGSTTGIVVDMGHDVCFIVPVYEGHAIPNGIFTMNFAGKEITNFMVKSLEEKGHKFSESNKFDVGQTIKEKLGYVALNFDEELSREANASVPYELPDGQVISVGIDRFRTPETLFKPNLVKINSAGIHENTHGSISRCDVDIRKELYANIVLAGGTSIFPGMKERMQKEMTALAPGTTKVKIIEPAGRKFSDWNGGSQLGSLSTFKSMWVTKDNFDENGPSVVAKIQ